MKIRFITWILTIILLSGCGPRKKMDVEEMVRKPAENSNSALEIVPLLPPGVQALLDEAELLQRQDNNLKAIEVLHRARSIAGNAATIMQYLAEAYLLEADFKQARVWAEQAVENGPENGALCQRSRRTLAIAAEQLGLTDLQFRALQSIENCVKEPINRY